MTKLNPCPFCTGTNLEPHLSMEEVAGVFVRCLDCRTDGPVKDTRDEAEAQWNSRPQTSFTLRGVPSVHKLKIWPNYFQSVVKGEMTFQVRKDDRTPAYQPLDTLVLEEFDPIREQYTDRRVAVTVVRVWRGFTGLAADHCAMSIVMDEAHLEGMRIVENEGPSL